jgi:hypothetical protein
MNLDNFPEEIIEEYKLRDIASKDGGVIAECRRCVYGLPPHRQEYLQINIWRKD